MAVVKERLKQFLTHRNLSDQDFIKSIGASRTYISSMVSGLGKYAETIFEKYPDLNRDWLLYGTGEMLNPSEREEEVSGYYTYKLPVSAMGGELTHFDTEGIDPRDCERILSPVRGVDMAIPIVGDSMAPDYPAGCTVFVKRIDPSAFINWGNVFVLDTTNGIILKVVDPSERQGYVTCSSLNPSGRYRPFDVPMRSIRAMYRVVASVTLR